MQFENLIFELTKSYENLVSDFDEFEKNPEAFNQYDRIQLAYGAYYKSQIEVPFEISLIFLKYECKKWLNRMETTVFLFDSSVFGSSVTTEFLKEYELLRSNAVDEVISIELEMNRRLNNQRGILIKPLKGKKERMEAGAKGLKNFDLNPRDVAKVVYALSLSKLIPDVEKKDLAYFYSAITGFGSENARKEHFDLNDPIDKKTKEKIISRLKEAIDFVQNLQENKS